MTNELTTTTQPQSTAVTRPGFDSAAGIKLLMNLADIFSKSHLVPTLYKANQANCMIACSMAAKMNMDPLTVMQNLYIIQGKPSWSAQFLIANWNSCGRFSPIRYEWTEKRDGCRAVSTDLKTGEKLQGTLVTMSMAKGEGWIDKPGSKWKTMPEQMMMYRAAAFLVRAYGAEIALGLSTQEELEDVTGKRAEEPTSLALASAAQQAKIEIQPMVEVVEPVVSVAPSSASQTAPAPSNPPAEVVEAEVVTETAPAPTPAAPSPSAEAHAPALSQEMQQDAPISEETKTYIGQMLQELKPDPAKFAAALQKNFGIEKVKFLSEKQAQAVRADLEKKIANKRIQKWSTDQLPAEGGGAGEEPPFPTN